MLKDKHCGQRDDRGLFCTRFLDHTGPHSYSKPTSEAYLKDTLDALSITLNHPDTSTHDKIALGKQVAVLIRLLMVIKKRREVGAAKARETKARQRAAREAAPSGSVDFDAQLKSLKGK